MTKSYQSPVSLDANLVLSIIRQNVRYGGKREAADD